MLQLLSLRAVSTGIQMAAGLGNAAATATADAVAKAAPIGLVVAALPVQLGAKVAQAVSGDISAPARARRRSQGGDRMWIEVRGLNGSGSSECGRAVVDAVSAHPGVKSVRLDRPLSRLAIEIAENGPSLDDLCSAIDEAETRCCPIASTRTDSVPGDGLLSATTAVMVGVHVAALAVTVAGRMLRLPGAPAAVDGTAALVNYQPWVRRLLADRVGTGTAETALSLVALTANTLTLSPAKISVDLTLQALKAAECRATAGARARYGLKPAPHADHPDQRQSTRQVPLPDGAAEQYRKRMAFVQMVATGLIGVGTRNVTMASNAASATSPAALRTACEAFAATLGHGLADRHAVVPLRPESLRIFGRIDALLVDPRVLCSDKLRVASIRGSRDPQDAWARAQELLDADLTPGWHLIPETADDESGSKGAAEALLLPVPHPLASAVMAEARKSETHLVSVATEILGELRPAFDDIRPVDRTVDDALATAVTELQAEGRIVAVLSSAAGQALSIADVAMGIRVDADGESPWRADLMLGDLAGAWRVLHALPAAKRASQHGIAISTGASALAALFMVPGVRRLRGPGPVTVGAAAGLLSGYLLARTTIRAEVPRPASAYEWHAMSVQQVREVLMAQRDSDEVTTDPATAPEHSRRGTRLFSAAREFGKAAVAELTGDPLTPTLALCSAATAVLGSPTDAVLVGTVLTGNAMLATAQQLRAENRLNRLLAQQTPPARLVVTGPDGGRSYREVLIDQLRPGDVIEVRSDEVVPADARVAEAHDLEVDESSLTGESLSVQKQVEATPATELAERRCMIYAGTTVVAGTAVALVTATGPDTQTRRAVELASDDLSTVGLHRQLSSLMSRAFPVSAAGGALVGALGVVRKGGLQQALSNAIAVAVAAVPEGMPLMATLAQSASAQRLGKCGALVRVPRATEALGRVEVVCFDKTGTLSENRLRVTDVRPMAGSSREDVLSCAAAAAPAAGDDPHIHATDEAIIAAADAEGVSGPRPEPEVHLPFRSGRSFSASLSGAQLTVKGAPEVVLAACKEVGPEAADAVEALSTSGLRVIAVAQSRLSAQQARSIRNEAGALTELSGSGLTLTGFLGLSDTPRPQAPQLLADLAERGVAIRLITGDHPVTATAIAGELGVRVRADQVITGSEWNALSRRDQERVVCERVIFARMSPEQKVQVVQALEHAGRVCAMVGDGANDAAAIRTASVGIGVVARGSDSAHTTADLVLTDGRIETLVNAIDEGRRLWRGVEAAIAGLLGGNAGEILFSVIGTALSGDSPLNSRQLLLVNLLTDALPATSVAVSIPAGPVQRVGRGIDESGLRRAVVTRGTITAGAATAAWGMASVTGRRQRASTVALVSLVAVELGQTLLDSHAPPVVLTAGASFAMLAAMITTPGISQLVGCTPIGPLGWGQGLSAAAAALLAIALTNRLRSGPADAGSLPTHTDPVPTDPPPLR